MGEVKNMDAAHNAFNLLLHEWHGVCEDQKPTEIAERAIRQYADVKWRELVEENPDLLRLKSDRERRLVDEIFNREKKDLDRLCYRPSDVFASNFKLQQSTIDILNDIKERAKNLRADALARKLVRIKRMLCAGVLQVCDNAEPNEVEIVPFFLRNGCTKKDIYDMAAALGSVSPEELNMVLDWLDKNTAEEK